MLCPIMQVWLSICAVKSKEPAMFQFQKDEKYHQKWIFFYVRQASGAVVPKPGGDGGKYPPNNLTMVSI